MTKVYGFVHNLNWTHIRRLLSVVNPKTRMGCQKNVYKRDVEYRKSRQQLSKTFPRFSCMFRNIVVLLKENIEKVEL